MHKVHRIVSDLSADVFTASLLVYAVLLLCEAFRAGFVSYFFDLEVMALVVFAAGAVAVLTAGPAAGREGGVSGPSDVEDDAGDAGAAGDDEADMPGAADGAGEVTGVPGRAADD